jgi:hypothetical protein
MGFVHAAVVNVDTPLWVLLVASALGGAIVTGVVTFSGKVMDLRHRHDETRREHYVNLLLAGDDLQQALVNVTAAYNRLPSKPRADWEDIDLKLRDAANDTGKAADATYVAWRRAEQTVLLFAPRRVAQQVEMVADAMRANFLRTHRESERFVDDPASGPNQLPPPDFPEAWNDLRRAMRRDLGVRGDVV